SFPSITSNIISINENIGKINELITRHNFKTTQFDIQKTDAYKKLTKNYAIDFARKQNYENLLSAKDTITLEILAIELEIEQINSRINGIEKSLSETVKGAEKVNEYLGLYFGKNDIIVEVTKENKFKLLRSGKIANNLSEGEKTAIAFAYFISRLEDKNTTLVDTVIYLDDPISSLDSNH